MTHDYIERQTVWLAASATVSVVATASVYASHSKEGGFLDKQQGLQRARSQLAVKISRDL